MLNTVFIAAVQINLRVANVLISPVAVVRRLSVGQHLDIHHLEIRHLGMPHLEIHQLTIVEFENCL